MNKAIRSLIDHRPLRLTFAGASALFGGILLFGDDSPTDANNSAGIWMIIGFIFFLTGLIIALASVAKRITDNDPERDTLVWEKVKAGGKARYIGSFMLFPVIFSALITIFILGRSGHTDLSFEEILRNVFLVNMGLLVGAFLIGNVLWRVNGKRFSSNQIER
jgi:hypothetical protein